MKHLRISQCFKYLFLLKYSLEVYRYLNSSNIKLNYVYNKFGQIETETNRGTTSYDYDNNDNLVRITDPSGKGMEMGYNNRDLVSFVKTGLEINADTFNFSYDGNSNILNSTDAYGNSTLYTYDGYDRMKTATDPLGNITEIIRSNQGNTISILRKNSAQDILRQTITVNDPVGRMLSRTVKVSEGNDVIYTYIYSEDGRTVTVTDPNGGVYTVIKNEFGQIIRESDPLGNSIEYFYLDGRGNMTKKVVIEKTTGGSENTYTYLYEYNAQNKLEKITDPFNNVTIFTYDGLGKLITSKDAEGNTVNHEYDGFGRKIKTTKVTSGGLNIETNFEYYSDNKLKSITDAKGNKTSYEYDFQGRLSKVTYPDLTTIENTYTTQAITGGIAKKVITKQRDGTLVTDVYNLNGLIDNRSVSHGGVTSGTTFENYVYDALNRVTSMTDDDSTVGFTYDTLNRVKEETQQGKLVKYEYDKLNNLTKITYPDNRIIERTFDAVRRITAIKEGANTITSYQYAGKGYRYMSKQFGNGDAISYLYDQGKRLTNKEAKNSNNDLINKYVYAYNKVNMKTYEQRVHDLNKSDIYNYDALYKLKDITFNADSPISPTTFHKKKSVNFDKVDNILKIVEQTPTSTHELINTLTGVNAQLNQYTQFDQWGLAYDLNGNTSQKGTQFFTYDYRNQLVKSTDQGTEVTFKYDVLGRRIEKEVSKLQVTSSKRYFYAGNQVIEERDGSDTVIKQFIYGNGIDEVLRVDKDESGTMVPYYFHTNSIGSVTAITDNTGNLIERYIYDLYGMPTITDANDQIVNNSVMGNDYMFHGRRYDPETNLYYYRARYYDPIMGRFLQTDPLGYQDSMNLYQAFGMNGVNLVDPMGELIYFTGKDPKRDFEIFKQIFVNIGVSREKLDKTLKLVKAGKGKYLIVPTSYIPFAKSVDRDRDIHNKQMISKWRNLYTTNLKNTNRFRTRLEFIFSWIIQHPVPIEFSIDKYAFWGTKKKYKKATERARFKDEKYGRGVFLQPHDKLNTSGGKAIQIVVDPDPKTSLKGGEYHVFRRGSKEKIRGATIPLPLEATIVHEFGHAYALMKGYKPESHTSLNAEIAVLLENWYRLRTILKRYGLRMYH